MRFFLPMLALLFLNIPAWAQTTQEPESQAALQQVVATIQAEFASHGDRQIGHDTIHWSTRLESVTGCRAEISIRTVSHLSETTQSKEDITFSLASLPNFGVTLKSNSLELNCQVGEKCFNSTTTCVQTSNDGIVTDCTSASQRRDTVLKLQFDGDPKTGKRLQNAFRQAIIYCQVPQQVTF